MTATTEQQLLPDLPGCVNGIVGRDPWRIQCQGCATISEGAHLLSTIRRREMVFHPWPDGTNPRLCRDCRMARGCDCHRCESERQDTAYPTRGRARP